MNQLNNELFCFVDHGSDENLIKSLSNISEEIYLEKALDKTKLVQKEVQYRKKDGSTGTRKQWVKAGEEQKKQQPKAQNVPNESSSKDRKGSKKPSVKISGDFSDEEREEWNHTLERRAKKYGASFEMSGTGKSPTLKIFSSSGKSLGILETKGKYEVELTKPDGSKKTYAYMDTAITNMMKEATGKSQSDMRAERKKFMESVMNDMKAGKTLRITRSVKISGNSDSKLTSEFRYNKETGKVDEYYVKGTAYLSGTKPSDKPKETWSFEEIMSNFVKYDVGKQKPVLKGKGKLY